MSNLRYPFRAAWWFTSAALLIWGGCAHAQAPIIDGSAAYGSQRGYDAPAGNAQPAVGAGQSGELLLQLQALQQEVMQLRGIVEDQNHQIETLKQQGLDRYIDLDRRLGQLGAGAGAGAVAGDAAPLSSGSGAEPATSAAASASMLPQVGQAATPPASAGAGAAATSGDSAAPINANEMAQANEYDAYKQAYAKVKEQSFPAAIQAFQAFIAAYPGSTLTPNAYYWLGELYLQTPQDLNASERAFAKVVADYPQHSKAPDSLYKLGRVYYMKGDKAKAQSTLQQVIDEYGASGSAAPQLAKQFLDQGFN